MHRSAMGNRDNLLQEATSFGLDPSDRDRKDDTISFNRCFRSDLSNLDDTTLLQVLRKCQDQCSV